MDSNSDLGSTRLQRDPGRDPGRTIVTKHVSKSQKQDKNKVLLNSLSSRFISNQKPLEVSTKLTQLSKLVNSGFSGVLVSSTFFFFLQLFVGTKIWFVARVKTLRKLFTLKRTDMPSVCQSMC